MPLFGCCAVVVVWWWWWWVRYGPPGCAKTTLVRALATACKVGTSNCVSAVAEPRARARARP